MISVTLFLFQSVILISLLNKFVQTDSFAWLNTGIGYLEKKNLDIDQEKNIKIMVKFKRDINRY